MTVFLRLVEASVGEKQSDMRVAIEAINGGMRDNHFESVVFERAPSEFKAVPGSPFCYWAPHRCLDIFGQDEPLNRAPRLVVSTNPLNADFRYVRVWWEIAPSTLAIVWKPWAKGGAFSPYYFDVNTVITWSHEQQSYSGFLGTENRPLERPASVQHFFRPGITWPRRTSGLSFRALPADSIFADKGPAVFFDHDDEVGLLALIALMNSKMFGYLVGVQLARTELAQSYEVGLVQQTPVPTLSDASRLLLGRHARRAWSLRRSLDTANETSHAFVLPPGLNRKVTGVDRDAVEQELESIQDQVDKAAFELYRIGADDRIVIESVASGNRSITEVPADVEGEVDDEQSPGAAHGERDTSWLVGVAFCRFDLRLATGERTPPSQPEPFDALPTRSPGMYPEGEEPADRPDILVDDEGHPDDLSERSLAAAERVKVDLPENLRGWLAKEFFPLHIKMYSKSRRKAPVYWQLATSSTSYSIWLYIHTFTKDTFFRVQNDYVAPKLAHEERRLESLANELRDGGTAALRRALAAQTHFVEELRAFLDEVKRIAPLWKPHLDDGVVINFAPLWRLVPQNRSWQKELKATWDALYDGRHDWAHLAMHLWPERVVPKCAKDRSLAIAHGLEEFFWLKGVDGKWSARKTPTRQVDELVRERTSPAVKAALKSLLEAPVASGGSRRGRGDRRRGAPITEGEER